VLEKPVGKALKPLSRLVAGRKARYSPGLTRIAAGQTSTPYPGQEPTTMDEQEIQEKVIAIVAEQMGVDKGEISRDTSFVNDLNADSLDTVELVMEFEDEFETSIPDEEAEKIDTVGKAIDFIKENYGG
jgi:acyl carrier protein